jgi:hypothetical protein
MGESREWWFEVLYLDGGFAYRIYRFGKLFEEETGFASHAFATQAARDTRDDLARKLPTEGKT